MAVIQVSPAELKSQGQKIESYSDQIGTITKQMDTLLQQVQAEWQGSSSNAFMRQYDDLKPQMTKFVQVVHDIGNQAINIASTLEQTDADIAKKIGG